MRSQSQNGEMAVLVATLEKLIESPDHLHSCLVFDREFTLLTSLLQVRGRGS